MLALQIVCFMLSLLSFLLLIHTYWLYPKLIVRLSYNAQPFPPNGGGESLPTIAVIVAAYNEEKYIGQKILTTLHTDYPLHKLKLYVGSDASTDQTNAIVAKYLNQYPDNIVFKHFETRTGKPEIVNQLAAIAAQEILVLTDSDTMFNTFTLNELIKPFADSTVGGVQAHIEMGQPETADTTVFRQEYEFNTREMLIKKSQSTDGCIIGANGPCYALRKTLYQPVPPYFSVDDFFIFMNILKKGYKTVYADDATCSMDVSGESKLQFRRKMRMGTGNYANLFYFKSMLNPFKNKINYHYFSHKVLRWITPFLLIVLLVSNLILTPHHLIFQITFGGQMLFYALALLDFFCLRAFNIHNRTLRYISHFVLMNLAFLMGFKNYIEGNTVGFWNNRPPQRTI